MDPLTGLNAACNIIDIVDRVLESARNVKELYDTGSGMTKFQERLKVESRTIQVICDDIERQSDAAIPGQLDQHMKNVAESCWKTAEKLIKIIEERLNSSPSRKSFVLLYLHSYQIARSTSNDSSWRATPPN